MNFRADPPSSLFLLGVFFATLLAGLSFAGFFSEDLGLDSKLFFSFVEGRACFWFETFFDFWLCFFMAPKT
jgi:hypothetical protein